MLKSFTALGHGGYLNRSRGSADDLPDDMVDFSANINPLGPPSWLGSLIGAQIDRLAEYPDPDSTGLVRAVADRFGVDEREVLAGNGSSEILYALPRALKKRRALIVAPAYGDYRRAARLAGLKIDTVILTEDDNFELDPSDLSCAIRPEHMVFLGQPANPSGMACDTDEITRLAGQHPETIFVVDEAFIDFLSGVRSLRAERPPNVIVLYSMTKIFALAGLRLGCAFARPEILDEVRELLPPWTVNTLAQSVGALAVSDRVYVRKTRKYVRDQRTRLSEQLSAVGGLRVFDGAANYLLDKIERADMDACELARKLSTRNVAIRVCDNFEGLDRRFFRVAVRTKADNDLLVSDLKGIFAGNRAAMGPQKKTPALMVQGLGSSAGKSVLCTALCRILLQDGYAVAPFKAQNMSPFSHVTVNGSEMARAQAVQARAAHLEPDARMNPILLKPSPHGGCRVIVDGQPVGDMTFDAYFRYRNEALKAVHRAYDALSEAHDIIVLEGAGSPAEINLKDRDIANMHMARYADSPVLIAGDIDRGGVFASFVGTMSLLDDWECRLVKGFVINRFRGDKSLLRDGLASTEAITGRPFLGVVPYLPQLGLPEEDAVESPGTEQRSAAKEMDSSGTPFTDLPHRLGSFDLEPALDRVASAVRESLDMAAIYEHMGLK